MRRLLYPLRLASARLRHRSGLALLIGLGVAVGAGALAAVLGGSLVAQDRALGRNLQQLDPAQRVLRVTWGGVPGQSSDRFASLDAAARAPWRRSPTGPRSRPPCTARARSEARSRT